MNYKIAILALVALQAVSISAQRCGCGRSYKPVCGSDGVTYDNDCQLGCKRSFVTKAYDGPCNNAVPCICPENINLVCGSDGITYTNECKLNCATASDSSLRIAHAGKCSTVKVQVPSLPSCTCPAVFSPVCGTNGKTYNNDCLLNCATAYDHKLGVSHQGKCGDVNVANAPISQNDCTCPRDMVLVCGSDGRTYNNLCLLECAGQSMARYGSC